jgi:hypothetical protein
VLKTITAVWNVLDILFTGRKTKADERLHRAVMNTALVILS